MLFFLTDFFKKFYFIGYFANNVERKGLASFYKEQPIFKNRVIQPTYTLIRMIVIVPRNKGKDPFDELIQIIFTYIHGSAKYEEYIRHIDKWINEPPYYPTAIIGDMNWHYPTIHPMKRYMLNNGFQQLIEKPTHDEGHTLDHIYVNAKLTDMKIEIFQKPVHFSDHDVVFLKLNASSD